MDKDKIFVIGNFRLSQKHRHKNYPELNSGFLKIFSIKIDDQRWDFIKFEKSRRKKFLCKILFADTHTIQEKISWNPTKFWNLFQKFTKTKFFLQKPSKLTTVNSPRQIAIFPIVFKTYYSKQKTIELWLVIKELTQQNQ